jgi:hypothetical protein
MKKGQVVVVHLVSLPLTRQRDVEVAGSAGFSPQQGWQQIMLGLKPKLQIARSCCLHVTPLVAAAMGAAGVRPGAVAAEALGGVVTFLGRAFELLDVAFQFAARGGIGQEVLFVERDRGHQQAQEQKGKVKFQ